MSLDELLAKREQTLAKLERIIEFIKEFKNKDNINLLIARHDLLELIYREFDDTQFKIEIHPDNKEPSRECRASFERAYFAAISDIKTIVDKQTKKSKNSGNAPVNTEVKLPTLSLPTFSGSYSEWTAFYDTFDALINHNTNLNDCQRFHYLKSCLQDEAAAAIESLSVSDANYHSALDILKRRYENKRLIAHEHAHNIINAPIIGKSSNTTLKQLLNTVTANLESLKVLKADSLDIILVPLIADKLDYASKREWQNQLTAEIPNWTQLKEFLEKRIQILDSMNQFQSKSLNNQSVQKGNNFPNKSQYSKLMRTTVTNTINVSKTKCHFCKELSHLLFNCTEFNKLPIKERLDQVNKLKLCINCLRNNHTVSECKSTSSCKQCKQRHNTILHSDNGEPSVSVTNCLSNNFTSAILPTAIIHIKDLSGNYHDCRVLLDVASQSHVITEALCKKLGLKTESINLSISGVQLTTTAVTRVAHATIQSKVNNFTAIISCLVLKQITHDLPVHSFPLSDSDIPRNVKLADPSFNVSGPIDLLIGVQLFWELLKQERIKYGKLSFHETKLGWVAARESSINHNISVQCNSVVRSEFNLANQVAKLWELDNCTPTNTFSYEEKQCEKHFCNTYKRDDTGRFIVKLPFRSNITELGSSEDVAIKRFYALERRLQKNPELKQEYKHFLHEYLELDHMELIQPESVKNDFFYLPHHPVLKASSTTTKLRTVFDASVKSTTGISLNDALMVGPTIQQDLFAILTRFRTYSYILSADIAKMYRQIWVDPNDRKYQCIFWRDEPELPINVYQLKTVTYGTSAAPYLAVKCVQQLANEEQDAFPLAFPIIMRDFYVDDLLTGTNNVAEAIELRNQLIELLNRGGFQLRKWVSNCPQLLPEHDGSSSVSNLNLDYDNNTKTLGLLWNPGSDTLTYTVNLSPSRNFTKRSVLSLIAQIFDPLGLIAPVIVTAKIILQQLWQLNIDWDEQIPDKINDQWSNFIKQIHLISSLNIPRQITLTTDQVRLELHGFCDASIRAYGACLYIRCITDSNSVTNLICAKSRVAPLKTTSLPRLELCGAVLLARLTDKLLQTINLNFEKFYYWTDSTIVLSWLNAPPNTWQTFVANRVSEIQTLTNVANWHHVRSEQNSADIISRGSTPSDIIQSKLWWNGPEFLQKHESEWPQTSVKPTISEVPEKRSNKITVAVINRHSGFLDKFSKFTRAQRVTAFVERFIYNARNPSNKRTGTLTVLEMKNAVNTIIKIVQIEAFAAELKILQRGEIPKQGPLYNLNPFIDNKGIIRVGGRLRNAQIDYEKKFPAVLPAKHNITKLIMIHYHELNLHAGPQATLASIREQFWPISGRNTVRHLIHKCIKCFKTNPVIENQLMGDLPGKRVQPARPFVNCGLDFAGPVNIKLAKGRGRKTIKSYIVLFICFATKAVHLELVTDYSTDSFLAALRRFISRRGKSAHIYSDNALNFVGANRELHALRELFLSSNFQTDIIDNLVKENIQWHFIPPRSPHRGGLWERAIQSTKKHIKRIAGNALLTFEEFYTLLTQIEACLNSRPITPLSSDPNDFTPLTPGHFLIGDQLLAPVEPDLKELKMNRLSRWQYIQQLQQHFWKRWSSEYLSSLQTRSKWNQRSESPLREGMVVLLKEENLPPLNWRLGRISSIHPGKDGVIRTVTVKTNTGEYMRASNKVCILPLDEENHQ